MSSLAFSHSRTLSRVLYRSSFGPLSRRTFASTSSSRDAATATATPSSSSSESPSPKIDTIVDQIESLTLIEASQLVTALKTRLNISDIPIAAAAAAPAAAPSAAGESADQEQEKPKEKTLFTINLVKIDPAKKAKVIKEVKALMPNMNLVEAKKFVESLPQVLKQNASKEEVEKMTKALQEAGADIKTE